MESTKNSSSALKKFFVSFALLAVIALAIVVYYQFFFVFGEGVKTGQLNYIVKKGYVFKTYEGKLIQSGFRASGTPGVQSYEFEFSVDKEAVAKKLMLAGGRDVELYYREYKRSLPWRGYSKYVVDSIVAIREIPDVLKENVIIDPGTTGIGDSIQ